MPDTRGSSPVDDGDQTGDSGVLKVWAAPGVLWVGLLVPGQPQQWSARVRAKKHIWGQ